MYRQICALTYIETHTHLLQCNYSGWLPWTLLRFPMGVRYGMPSSISDYDLLTTVLDDAIAHNGTINRHGADDMYGMFPWRFLWLSTNLHNFAIKLHCDLFFHWESFTTQKLSTWSQRANDLVLFRLFRHLSMDWYAMFIQDLILQEPIPYIYETQSW